MTKHLNKNRVVVAMSGGVDSSVSAYLLKKQGYEVIGISMKTHESPESRVSSPESKSCCSVDDIMDARAVCQKLEIPFYAMNFKKEFKEQVMDYFADEYANGRTPNPCVKCNEHLKFNALLKEAQALGAYYLATGHFVKKIRDKRGIWHLYRAADNQKDQSYFLFGLNQEQLEHIIFPIGELKKEEVRDLAREALIVTADKAESQEICFVPNNDYASVLEKMYPEKTNAEGIFRSCDGEILGKHRGSHAYTIGQRRNLRIATGKRVYVTGIDCKNNEVILGRDEDLYHSQLLASDLNWITDIRCDGEIAVEAKIRYRQRPSPARLHVMKDGKARVYFTDPQRAITPGQAVVFYRDQELLGGGWIEKTL
jgi:tRNA-specific 2-thiouridylase